MRTTYIKSRKRPVRAYFMTQLVIKGEVFDYLYAQCQSLNPCCSVGADKFYSSGHSK